MKAITRLALKHISRERLQKLAPFVKPVLSVAYRGNQFEDPISGIKYRKLLPYGRVVSRANALAPDSLSLERHRLLWLFLKEKTDFFARKLRVLHLAPEHCFQAKFREMENLEYITADLCSPLADVHFDAHDIPFKDDYFDVVIANHLLEHVEDDRLVMRECLRVMKPGGWGIFQVPIDYNLAETYEDDSIVSPEEREKHFWQNDHLRLYGQDYPNRLKAEGFRVRTDDFISTLGEWERARYALPKHEPIYFCHKPIKLKVVEKQEHLVAQMVKAV